MIRHMLAAALALLTSLSVLLAQGSGPTNVILMIGDGMGVAQLTAGRTHKGSLELERFTSGGLSVTHAAGDDYITDSAAGATAYACGIKTLNGMIAVAPDGTRVRTLAELACSSIEGKLVAPVVVSHGERVPTLPSVPSVKEPGQYVTQHNFRGVSVPPGTPQEIIDFLEDAFGKAFKDPEFQSDLKKVGIFPFFRGHKDFVKYYQDEAARYGAIAKEFGIEPK